MTIVVVLEPDDKFFLDIQNALDRIKSVLNLNFDIHRFYKISEIDTFLLDLKKQQSDVKVLLAILPMSEIKDLNTATLEKIKQNYSTDIVLTGYDKPQRLETQSLSWPIKNIIYKPFDELILHEHLHFALSENKIIKTKFVHNSAEKYLIEKIRRNELIGLSDFGFRMKSESKYHPHQLYKFYHTFFQRGTHRSCYARWIKSDNHHHDFVFYQIDPEFMSSLRLAINHSKNKLKSMIWDGVKSADTWPKLTLMIQLKNQTESSKIVDYVQRKFPQITCESFELPNQKVDSKASCDFLITDQTYDIKILDSAFVKRPLVISVGPKLKTREELEKVFEVETLKIFEPIDRNFLGKILKTYYPQLKESEPIEPTWVTDSESFLQSDIMVAENLSESSLIFDRLTLLDVGGIQEFALPHAAEEDMETIIGKIHGSSPVANEKKMYPHQVVFFGMQDHLLKQIRLWMMSNYIKKHGKE